MARAKSPTLTEAEFLLMDVLWRRGPSTAREVAGELSGRRARADSTVRTTLRTLEQKGFVRHSRQGRAFTYHPVVKREEARRSAVRNIIHRFFNNSPELLLLNVIEHQELDTARLRRLRSLLEKTREGRS
jgi:predicted transcriptional regulator